jgi:predicted nucleic acid-binding protein
VNTFLDANVVLRYLTDDPPALAERAAILIDSGTELTISPLILAEVGYVLTKTYQRDREQVVDALVDFVQRDNLQVYHVDTDIAVEALERCRPSNRVSFADTMLWAEARSSGGVVYTFDERFPGEGIQVRRP